MNQAAMRTLWREYTNERDTVVISDTAIDLYLQRGLEALNRRARYHVTDGTIALVAGQAEYDLPADFIEAVFVQWSTTLLSKNSIDQWRSDGVDFRGASAANPTEYAIYGRKLILNPKPSTTAISTAASLTLRYYSAPGDFATAGPEQIDSQDHALVVYYAVAEWSRARADGPISAARMQGFQGAFEAEAKVVQAQYANREMQR